MSEEDSRLADEIKNIVHKNNMYYSNTEITGKKNSNNILDIVNTKELIDTDKIDNILSLINFNNKKLKNSLFFQLIDKVTPSWDKMYIKLKEFINVNNRLPKKTSKDKSEESLYRWLIKQKISFKRNKLTKEQTDLLFSIEEVKEYFETDYTKSFEEGVNELKDFISINDRLPIYNKKNIKDNIVENSLYGWLVSQKKNFKNNKLSQEEIDLLFSIGEIKEFIETEYIRSFDEWFNELKDFVSINDRLPKYGSKDEYEKSLYGWLSRQKVNFKNNKLTEEQINKLFELSLVRKYFEYSK